MPLLVVFVVCITLFETQRSSYLASHSEKRRFHKVAHTRSAAARTGGHVDKRA